MYALRTYFYFCRRVKLGNILILERFSKEITELLWFCFTTLCDWFKKSRATYSTNQMQNQNQSRLGRMRFPAFSAGYVYLLQALIGSLLVYVCCDWPLVWFWFYDTQLKNALTLQSYSQ